MFILQKVFRWSAVPSSLFKPRQLHNKLATHFQNIKKQQRQLQQQQKREVPQKINRYKASHQKRMPNYESYNTPTKPNENCRTCTDFKFWSKQQRQIFHKAGPKDEGAADKPRREDCPLDKGEIGKATWSVIHTIGAFYPDNPTETDKKDMKCFFEVLARLYPCEYCAKDFQKDLKNHPVDVESQHALTQWLCRFHNRVNEKLGKKQFDCSKVNERWRDGWLDGSCD